MNANLRFEHAYMTYMNLPICALNMPDHVARALPTCSIPNQGSSFLACCITAAQAARVLVGMTFISTMEPSGFCLHHQHVQREHT